MTTICYNFYPVGNNVQRSFLNLKLLICFPKLIFSWPSQTKFNSWPNQVGWTDIYFLKTALVTAANDKSFLPDKLSSGKVFINIWFGFCTIAVHWWDVRVQQRRPIWGGPQGLRDVFWHCWTTLPIKHISHQILKVTFTKKNKIITFIEKKENLGGWDWLTCGLLAHGGARGAQRVYVTKLKYFSCKIWKPTFMGKEKFWVGKQLVGPWICTRKSAFM